MVVHCADGSELSRQKLDCVLRMIHEQSAEPVVLAIRIGRSMLTADKWLHDPGPSSVGNCGDHVLGRGTVTCELCLSIA